MNRYYCAIIACSCLFQVQFATANPLLNRSEECLSFRLENANTSITDTLTNPTVVESYANILTLLISDPILRSELNASQLKTLSYYDSVYKKNSSFRSSINKSMRGAPLSTKKAQDNTKESSDQSKENAKARKKATVDSIKKLLDILSSMNPQI